MVSQNNQNWWQPAAFGIAPPSNHRGKGGREARGRKG